MFVVPTMGSTCARLLLRGNLPMTAAAFAVAFSQPSIGWRRPLTTRADSTTAVRERDRRTRETAADLYFEEHGRIPRPSTVHYTLAAAQTLTDGASSRQGILVIGDVHGCFDELLDLHEKAVEENDGKPFEYVILVGDLCNKGPKSASVIRYVRLSDRWLSIRGNHDDGALAAALGDSKRRARRRYQWVSAGEAAGRDSETTDSVVLSDEDVVWLSDLPYTLRIPSEMLSEPMDTIIVHAGFVPGVQLEDQTIETMVTIREVQRIRDGEDSCSEPRYEYRRRGETDATVEPWASVWKGPERVIFGHDARRGLQLREDNWTCGLDSGACYGKKLTGLILPKRKLVQVEAREVYCPPGVREA